MTLPHFITFSGCDDQSDIARMGALSQRYPIEWALLMSPERQGQGRYPSLAFLERLITTEHPSNLYPREAGQTGMFFAAHLCGDYARLATRAEPLPIEVSKLVCACDRVQVNLRGASVDAGVVQGWAAGMALDAILQCGPFPDDDRVLWLHDLSAGRGVKATAWPEQVGAFVGYAGGLNPQSVAGEVASIAEVADAYWIDMEQGVRDAQDRFDLDKVAAVCAAVYPML